MQEKGLVPDGPGRLVAQELPDGALRGLAPVFLIEPFAEDQFIVGIYTVQTADRLGESPTVPFPREKAFGGQIARAKDRSLVEKNPSTGLEAGPPPCEQGRF